MTFPKCAIPWRAWRIHTNSYFDTLVSSNQHFLPSKHDRLPRWSLHRVWSALENQPRGTPSSSPHSTAWQKKKKHPIFLYVSLSIRISIFMRAVTEDGTDGAVTASLNSDAVANGDDNKCSCIQIRLQTRGFRWGRLELHTARLQLHIWAIRRGPELQPFRRESNLWWNKNLLESAYLHQGRINNHTWRIPLNIIIMTLMSANKFKLPLSRNAKESFKNIPQCNGI